MERSLKGLSPLVGRYEGEGAWCDETGESKRYRIEMRFERESEGEMRHWFRHIFFEEQTETEQAVRLSLEEGGRVSASMENVRIKGRGYFTGSALHYELDVPNNRIEVTHLFGDAGAVHVLGSSERNTQGRFIWWEENLRRV